LAHRDDDTLVVSFQSDGDLFYTASALWTAAHHRLPLLWIVVNNRTYGQDRMHQSLMADRRQRHHDVGVGIDICDPAMDVAALARAQGVEAWGPVSTDDHRTLTETLARAATVVRNERRPVLVDVLVDYEGGRS
jgi:Thiamine pyrophosphate-requiring enzymes [acetolactate synthase, pyruvate dehydrogenase (cytochrome), glyoxylate carboligase, phosphonopyruvate decarboxylase]